MAFASQTYLLSCYDARICSELISDTGYPADVTGDNAVLQQFLDEASEQISAAALVGNRYTHKQLFILSQCTDRGFMLRRLTCDLAFGLIVSRRGRSAGDINKLCPRYTDALQTLEKLQTGLNIFPGIDDLEYETAGTPSNVNLNTPVPGVQSQPLITSFAARIFPVQSPYAVGPRGS
jgi:phage gp36-like protein